MELDQGFREEVTRQKTAAENHARELTEEIRTRTQQIRDAKADDPNVPRWRREMRVFQNRLAEEPEAAVSNLCAQIHERTGLDEDEIFRRNTEATNQGLRGQDWANFMLAANQNEN